MRYVKNVIGNYYSPHDFYLIKTLRTSRVTDLSGLTLQQNHCLINVIYQSSHQSVNASEVSCLPGKHLSLNELINR